MQEATEELGKRPIPGLLESKGIVRKKKKRAGFGHVEWVCDTLGYLF